MRALGSAPAAVLLLVTAAVAQTGGDKPPITLDRVAGNVYVVNGTFTHAALSIGDDGVLLVDGTLAESADESRAILRRLTDKPLKFVVDTHCHSDHTGANAAYKGSAPIVAHANVAKRLSTGTEVCPKGALPDITFEGASSIYFNGEEVRLLTLPAGHTDSDLIVYFTKSKVAHIGDLYVPPLGGADRSNGGRFLGLIDGLAYVIRELPADTRVIPGHGAPIAMAELVSKHELLSKAAAFVDRGVQAGKTVEQLKGASELAELRAVLGSDDQVDWFVGGLYRELARK